MPTWVVIVVMVIEDVVSVYILIVDEETVGVEEDEVTVVGSIGGEDVETGGDNCRPVRRRRRTSMPSPMRSRNTSTH
jgi:hypothetical protein